MTHPDGLPAPQLPDAEASPYELLNALLEQRRVVAGLPVVLFVIVVAAALVWPRSYTARATFMPQSNTNSLARFASIAAQFGVTIPGQDPGQSPEFYADLVASDELLRGVVDSTYAFTLRGEPVRRDLVALWGGTRDSLAARREEAVRALRRKLGVSIDPKTNLVRVSVWSRSPELSAQVVQGILGLVNAFNLRKRQSQASQEARFIEGRLADAKAELRVHEDDLQAFLQRNREYRNSAQLQFEHDRLEREVNLRQQTLSQLAQAFEVARIDEVRNTPVITVVEQPIVPPEPDSRRLVLKGLLAIIGGGVLAMLLAIGRETMRRLARARPDASNETRRLLREALAELPGRRARRGEP
jgi:uncharacterized protein involved in exopolysaccharide biosynthesis